MLDTAHEFDDPNVAAVFEAFPEAAREHLLAVRALIFDVAADTPEAGCIIETLKWGQPAYLTPETKSGTPIRLWPVGAAHVAILCHCQTSLIREFHDTFPNRFEIDGNRAVHIPIDAQIPREPLAILIHRALTYHLNR